jgi:hypothetical protein
MLGEQLYVSNSVGSNKKILSVFAPRCFIPEEVAEASLIFLRKAYNFQNNLTMRNCRRDWCRIHSFIHPFTERVGMVY